MSQLPTNRSAVVLGASRGLGRATCIALAKRGFTVAAVCRRDADAIEVVRAVEDVGGLGIPLQADVLDLGAVERAITNADSVAPLFCLVNNAGTIEPIGLIEETDPSAWANLIALNVVGAYHGTRSALRVMRAGGVIINLSSGAASNPMEGWSAYCASKAALAMLTRSIHHEAGKRDIAAYGFRPGLVDTAMQGAIRSSGLNPISQVDQSDLLPPDVPAEAIAWLCDVRPADLRGCEVDIRDNDFQLRVAQ